MKPLPWRLSLFPSLRASRRKAGRPIVTEDNGWDELPANVREAVRGYYFDQPEKLAARIRLRLVRDEALVA